MSQIKIRGYTPAQVAKALAASATAAIGILTLLAAELTSGPLHAVGAWATVAAFAITPFAVFMTKAAPLIDVLDGDGDNGADMAAGG